MYDLAILAHQDNVRSARVQEYGRSGISANGDGAARSPTGAKIYSPTDPSGSATRTLTIE